jgi:hypothetical protein
MKFILFSVIVFFFNLSAAGQVVYSDKSISRIKISSELKEKLKTRFELYVKYQIERNYEKQFELLSPRLIGSGDCQNFLGYCYANKNQFLRRQKKIEKWLGAIKKITLQSASKKLDKSRNMLLFTTWIEASDIPVLGPHYLEAFLENNEWYFSTFYTVEI